MPRALKAPRGSTNFIQSYFSQKLFGHGIHEAEMTTCKACHSDQPLMIAPSAIQRLSDSGRTCDLGEAQIPRVVNRKSTYPRSNRHCWIRHFQCKSCSRSFAFNEAFVHTVNSVIHNLCDQSKVIPIRRGPFVPSFNAATLRTAWVIKCCHRQQLQQ